MSEPLPQSYSDYESTEESNGSSSELDAAAYLLELGLVALCLVVGRYLHHRKISWIGDAGAALIIGLLVGLIFWLAGAQDTFGPKIVFKGELFLFVLLPTIIFDAGYSLDPKPFIRNIGSICLFAFAGTTISTFVIGLFMWGMGQLGLCYELSLLYNLIFGSLISATDPVTVLAVFQKLGANEELYINVFGESVLNDAVAIVLYNTVRGFLGKPVTAVSVVLGVLEFCGIFLGSVAVGVLVGFATALIIRTKWIPEQNGSLYEVGLVVLLAYISYLGAQAAYMSGIVSILFCGMVMSQYVRPNLTPLSEARLESLFRILAGLFELFLFIYIGVSLFLNKEVYNIWTYTAWCLLALGISRALNIFPLALLTNFFRERRRRIPFSHQFMLWWAGLRGAVAFALAVDAAEKYGRPGRVMQTCTFYLIFITVLVNGGACQNLLEWLRLRKVDEVKDSLPLSTASTEMAGLTGSADEDEDKNRRRGGVEADTKGTSNSSSTAVTMAYQSAVPTEIGHGHLYQLADAKAPDRPPLRACSSSGTPLLTPTSEYSAQPHGSGPESFMSRLHAPHGSSREGGIVRSHVHAPGLAGWEEEEMGEGSVGQGFTSMAQQLPVSTTDQSQQDTGFIQDFMSVSHQSPPLGTGYRPQEGSVCQSHSVAADALGSAANPVPLLMNVSPDSSSAHNNSYEADAAAAAAVEGRSAGATQGAATTTTMYCSDQASPAAAAQAAAVAAAVAAASATAQGQPTTPGSGRFLPATSSTHTPVPLPPVQGGAESGRGSLALPPPQQQQLSVEGASGVAILGHTTPELAQQQQQQHSQQDQQGGQGTLGAVAVTATARGGSPVQELDTEGVDRRSITSKYVPKVLHPYLKPVKGAVMSVRELTSNALEKRLAKLDERLSSYLILPPGNGHHGSQHGGAHGHAAAGGHGQEHTTWAHSPGADAGLQGGNREVTRSQTLPPEPRHYCGPVGAQSMPAFSANARSALEESAWADNDPNAQSVSSDQSQTQVELAPAGALGTVSSRPPTTLHTLPEAP